MAGDRKSILDQLTQEAQDAGMYDPLRCWRDLSPTEYDALREARRPLAQCVCTACRYLLARRFRPIKREELGAA